jgi:dTDP-4-dehydrorhamnose reductase
MKRVLVTGASGLLGSKIVESARNYTVYPTHQAHPHFQNSIKMDVTDEREVKQVLDRVKPNIVIHTAAETNVERCESDRNHAWKTNADGTRILAEACNKMNATMTYISTDYVFDGEKGRYREEAQPNPVNYYGQTKLTGEEHVKELCERYATLRTSVLYGTHPTKLNFATWTVTSLLEKKPLMIVEDHFNSPTLADNLARAAWEMVEKELWGVYHVAGTERISRYDFALKMAEVFNLDVSLVKPIRMSELKTWTAKRPKDSSLRVDKIQSKIDVELLDVTRGLLEMKREWARTR